MAESPGAFLLSVWPRVCLVRPMGAPTSQGQIQDGRAWPRKPSEEGEGEESSQHTGRASQSPAQRPTNGEGRTGPQEHDLPAGLPSRVSAPDLPGPGGRGGKARAAAPRCGRPYHGAEGSGQLVNAARRREDEHLVAQGLRQLAQHKLQHLPVRLLQGEQPLSRSAVSSLAAAWPPDPSVPAGARAPLRKCPAARRWRPPDARLSRRPRPGGTASCPELALDSPRQPCPPWAPDGDPQDARPGRRSHKP